jgi:threonine dehydrogenase-like Zn-dependent dehydrogenase
MGAKKVIVIDAIDERLELAKAFGADELIDMRELQTPAERMIRVRELTNGWGANVVAELVGFPHIVAEGLDLLGNCGRYLEIGNISPLKTFEFDPSGIVLNNKSIVGVMLYPPPTLKKALDFLLRAKERYPFDRILSHTYSLDEISEAFDEQNEGHVCRSSIVF